MSVVPTRLDGAARETIRLPGAVVAAPPAGAPPPVVATPSFAALPPAAPWPVAGFEVACARASFVGGAPCMLLRNATQNALAVIQPLLWSGIYPAWGDGDAGLVTLWTVSKTVPAAQTGGAAWTLSAADEFVAADVDGDGVDELFVFNMAGARAALLRWSNGLVVEWSAQGSIPGSDGVALAHALQVAALDTGGAELLAVLDPAGAQLALLSWQDSALAVASSQMGSVPGGWTIGGGNTLACTADLDGSGVERLILLDGDSRTLGVVARGGAGDLETLWSGGSIPGVGGDDGWTVQGTEGVYAACLDTPGTDRLVLWAAGVAVGVAWWVGGTLVTALTPQDSLPGQGSIPALSPISFSASVVQVADLDGDGLEELVVVQEVLPMFSQAMLSVAAWSPQGLVTASAFMDQVPAPGSGAPLAISDADVWCVAASSQPGRDQIVWCPQGTGMAVIAGSAAGLACTWQAGTALPSWGISLLAGAPQSPLADAPFAGAQADVYAWISDWLSPGSGGDLRKEYVNALDEGSFGTWAQTLENAAQPQNGYSQDDWDAVRFTLAAELTGASTAYSYRDQLNALAVSVSQQQQADLTHVATMVPPDASSNPTLAAGYWGGQCGVALLWAAAAATGELPLVAMGLSALASLVGSALSGDGSETSTVELTVLENQIATTYTASTGESAAWVEAILMDQYKLPILGLLGQGAWAWDEEENSVLSSGMQDANRLMFYQSLLPPVYTIWTWTSTKFDFPHDWAADQLEPADSWNTYVVEVAPNMAGRAWDVYLMWSADNQAPTQAMMDEIFGMGVTPAEFFPGAGPWAAIPHQEW